MIHLRNWILSVWIEQDSSYNEKSSWQEFREKGSFVTNTLNRHHAVYVGSFDPPTLGHLDIVGRGAEIYSKITVGVGINPDKKPLFSAEERLQMLEELLSAFPNVEVKSFQGLAVNFVRECGGGVMLRGLRTLTDVEAEFTMSLANRTLASDIETVFLMASEKYTHISSSLIKQIAQLGGDVAAEKLKDFVPKRVVHPLIKKFDLKNSP
ncbi:MAG: pantetheine-phosphate adenylyltransferase [Planctomycetes bacterium]|nr:pantetheine-phosphate adenylyltransferase [Planctomycetota bacterium]MCH9727550.1 pantetheine-phosphate adenylyltransferase [Planctomycetota bacterium]MCH9777470.1 pantetheine-phosphate adenylyltransferase [Planctomycetota bacterium]MCH9791367.1 pantetheine-phosphate adenylyltransferase [Planctomycetota bacterium]MDF1742825.1 pantetheine-phosphate adenylyltransferase [Gimesia sp.]